MLPEIIPAIILRRIKNVLEMIDNDAVVFLIFIFMNHLYKII